MNTLRRVIATTVILALFWRAELIASTVNWDFEDGTFGGLSTGALCCPDSAVVTTDEARQGTKSTRFTLNSTDPAPPKASKTHSELVKAGLGVVPHTRWYGFSIFIPTSYENDGLNCIHAQWHSNPDPGEDSKSPHLSLQIANGRWFAKNISDPNRITTANSTHVDIFDIGAVAKGVWTDWVVYAKWSYQSDGELKVWKNGQLLVNKSGPNDYNDSTQALFRFGIYKYPWKTSPPSSTKTIVVYHDSIKIGDANSSYAEVAPAGSSRPADTTAPVISNVQATNLSATGARISWDTNEAADTQVEYGLTTTYGFSTPLDTLKTNSHAQTLSGLAPNALYHYRVKSRDTSGNLATSGDLTFSTGTSPAAPTGLQITSN